LTNASCSLANSTITRLHRVHDIMRDLFDEVETHRADVPEDPRMAADITRLEVQAGMLIHALNMVYLALGAFSRATLITLIGTALLPFLGTLWYNALAFPGVALGALGVTCLIVASVRLFEATKISLANIREEADLIRARHGNKK